MDAIGSLGPVARRSLPAPSTSASASTSFASWGRERVGCPTWGDTGVDVGECRGWNKNLPQEHVFALAEKMRSPGQVTGVAVEGIFFASTGFQSGRVQHAQGYGIRLALVAKDQSVNAFTIAFAEYDEATGTVAVRDTGIGITEQVTVTDAGRIELYSHDGHLTGASDF